MSLAPISLIAVLFLVLGVRLLRSGFETSGSERWLGAFFAFAGLAAPLRIHAAAAGTGMTGATALANALAHVLIWAAVSAFTVFVWRVFRPHEAWSRALALSLLLALTLAAATMLALGGHRDEGANAVLVTNAIRTLPFGWAFVESCRYERLMARRLALGLADPLIANRFRLFSIWTGALFALPVVIMAIRVYVRIDPVGAASTGGPEAWTQILARATLVVCGSVAFGALWLGFFPPRRYRERITAVR